MMLALGHAVGEDLSNADLSIVASVSADPIHPGDPLTYTLRVKNQGPDDAVNISINDTLPDNVTFINTVWITNALPDNVTSDNAVSAQNSITGQTVWWNFTSLAVGNSEIITINVTIKNNTAAGVITNIADAYSDTPDPMPENNIAINNTTICLVDDGDFIPPSNVTGVIVTDAKDGKLDLLWDAATDNVGVDHYEIYRDGVLLVNVSGTSYQDSGLVNGQSYTYIVRAVDAAGNKGNFSDSVSGIPTETDVEAPSTVTGLTVTDAKDGKLDLLWDAATDNVGVDHYEIYRDGILLLNITGTSYQDTGLVNGNSYAYTVRAVDAAGNKGNYSDPVSGTPTKTSTPPTPSHNNPAQDENTAPITNTSAAGENDSNATITSIIEASKPLSQPTITGPTEGYTNIDYNFTISLNDSDSNIKFMIDWGDGHINESDYLAAGSLFTIHHKWIHPEEYSITVTTFDGQTNATTGKIIKIYTPNKLGANIPKSNNLLFIILALLALMFLPLYFLFGKRRKDEENKK